MSLSVSAIMPQIAFAQRIREFARAMLRRVVPGIPLEKLRFESDLIFETHVNNAGTGSMRGSKQGLLV